MDYTLGLLMYDLAAGSPRSDFPSITDGANNTSDLFGHHRQMHPQDSDRFCMLAFYSSNSHLSP